MFTPAATIALRSMSALECRLVVNKATMVYVEHTCGQTETCNLNTDICRHHRGHRVFDVALSPEPGEDASLRGSDSKSYTSSDSSHSYSAFSHPPLTFRPPKTVRFVPGVSKVMHHLHPSFRDFPLLHHGGARKSWSVSALNTSGRQFTPSTLNPLILDSRLQSVPSPSHHHHLPRMFLNALGVASLSDAIAAIGLNVISEEIIDYGQRPGNVALFLAANEDMAEII